MAEEKVLNEEVKDEENVDEPLNEENVDEPLNEENADEKNEEETSVEDKPKELSTLAKCLIAFVFPGLILIFYILSGFLLEGAWKINWLLFLAIPTYWSGLYAYQKKNWLFFLFPLIVVGVYLFIGFAMPDNKGWHPYWIMFIEIPLYYVAVFLVKAIVENKEEESLEETKEEQEEAEKEPEVVEEKPDVVVVPAPVEEKEEEGKEVPVVHIKEKKEVSNRRAKKAAQPKEKRVKVVTEKRNYNKEKRHLKIKADITHNEAQNLEAKNNEENE